ncbi:hypothetical protein GCM10011416_00930 [Polaribacter pacificus]|uniref:Response regulator receiver domain-containing protein n=1 Tax=Polaribacter pacificus TaxID=1775173 RepID=A0A917HT77_9FLAO|nr:response regulator [Polaribacter pacificus]GGG88482.1 hypothetical protein GCM10011416_00930 [Polaribacter pacificus]
MIYLIDDKSDRQNDFGWDKNKIDFFKDIFISITSYSQIEKREERELIFSDGNMVLFHESFFDNVENKHKKDGNEIRNALVKNSEEKQNFKVVFFSGSYNSRELNETGGSMPVSILYQNLDFFLNNFKDNNLVDLNYLFYGENPNIENELLQSQERSNSLLIDEIFNDKIESCSSNLLIAGNGQGFPNPFKSSINFTFYNKNISDSGMSSKIEEWFSEKEYDNIFIPLCFGSTLSDFNGLRLVLHIRCSDSINSLKNIFLYSFIEDKSMLWGNEYFDVLKTKNIQIIDYKKVDFQKAVDNELNDLSIEELPFEIKKVKLNPPKNYIDSHSIANEWAINRWSKTINVSDDRIEAIENKIESNLYFKYLNTIYPIIKSDVITDDKLKITYSGTPKVLYIDDEVEKGWGEIFAHFFDDINEIYFDYLVEDFKNINQEQLIKSAIQKIKDDDIDLVLLDFRLLPGDFNKKNIKEITGVKILNEIKELNPGIQVIIFSATNKIWNLQNLQDAGADGFILKESPENSVEDGFTVKSIENMVHVFNSCFERNFLKAFHLKIDELKTELLPRKNFKKVSNPLDINFVDEVLKWLQLSCELLAKNLNTASKTSSFLFLFSVLENLSNQIVSSEPIKIDNRSDVYFEFEFSRVNNRLVFFNENKETGLYSKTNNNLRKAKRGIPWAQKILNTLNYLNTSVESELDLNEIIGKRNDIIHANSSLKGKLEISNEELINLFNTVYNGLKKI